MQKQVFACFVLQQSQGGVLVEPAPVFVQGEILSHRRQVGFTLIELIVIIVILGALAAVALPRFADLRKDARVAAVNNLAGSVRTAANHWHLLCAAHVQSSLVCDPADGTYIISNNGQSVQMYNGWPDAGDYIGINEIDTTVQTSGFTILTVPQITTMWEFAAAPNPAACSVQYTEAISAGTDATVTVNTAGC
jgi:MSHA pilin protein MshA